MGGHDGHRARLKRRYLESGGGLEDADVLELLLFYSIPRRDVHPLAQSLLERFGSISGILDSSAGELCEIAGVGENSALLLDLLGRVRELQRLHPEREAVQFTFRDVSRFLLSRLGGAGAEVFGILCLDREGKYLSFKSVADLTVGDSQELCRLAMNHASFVGAGAVIAAHARPSRGELDAGDIGLALTMSQVLTSAHLVLLDYILVDPEGVTSLADGFLLRGRGDELRDVYRAPVALRRRPGEVDK